MSVVREETLTIVREEGSIERIIRTEPITERVVELVAGPRGAVGPEGPDPWMEPVQVIEASGPLEIDYSEGKHVKLFLDGDVTLTVTNWPPENRIARLTLEVQNRGSHSINWAPSVLWSDGRAPELTVGGLDIIVLTTTTSGTTVYAFVAGMNFS